jgi:spermidine dehydrogenase
MLGQSGFDADADIAAITVNRWGHGYSYGGDILHPDGREPERPYEIARARCGNVVFAGSDAAWTPLTSAAIHEAHRAVQELTQQP